MAILRSATLAPHLAVGLFWREALLNAVGPVVAALLGGLVVSLVVQRFQNRRLDLKEREEDLRMQVERKNQASVDVMRIAYGFYFRLIEVTRTEYYRHELRLGDLLQYYDEFRIAARVLEEQLRLYFPGGEARWLWHGVVDMLSLRYYRLAHRGPRVNGMIATHGAHPTDKDIPASIRSIFLSHRELRDNDTVDNVVMAKFEEMLEYVITLIVDGEFKPPNGDPVILRHGRGSRLG